MIMHIDKVRRKILIDKRSGGGDLEMVIGVIRVRDLLGLMAEIVEDSD